jgi:predicted AlkP superfamily phosphohydrolase/phosphomutase
MKVLFLGIDALDGSLLEKFEADLPNITALRKGHTSLKLRSTFPPDSDTAWATISTGMNPAQHGIVRFVDPLEKSYQILNVGSDNEILRGKTFWELAGRAGLKAHAIFPHLGYPIWETPGMMVVRGSSVASVQASPPELLNQYPNPDALMGVRGFPDRNLQAMSSYAQRLRELAQADAEFAFRLMNEHDWDLFFVYWSTLDATGHFFWNYYDREDPNFVEGHPLQDVIPNTYKLYDEIVGRFIEAVDENVTVIMMSDHGHGARPFKLVSVNEVLRQGGFLKARDMKANPHLNLCEKSKRLAVKTISRYGLGKVAGRVMRRFPGVVQSFTRPASVDWDRTIAYASDMSGIKAYPYGGVIINLTALGDRDYETVRTEIIELLQHECVLLDGTPLIKFIARREDLYQGPFIAKYPDIILEFEYGYGVGWALHVPLITQAASYNLVPGSHRGETGTFLLRTSRKVACDGIDLLDVTPTILDLMNVPHDDPYDGISVLMPERPRRRRAIRSPKIRVPGASQGVEDSMLEPAMAAWGERE